MQQVSLFGDEQILNDVSAQLLTFGNITGDVFDRTQRAVIDLAATLGGDLQGVSIQLGKALNDPVEGLSALRRSCLLYTSPSPRDQRGSRMPSSA